MSVHCLSVGNNYPGTSSALAGCVNDALDTAALFKPFCKSVTTLLDSKADRAGVMRAGRKWLDRLAKGDIGILSVSGHGTREKSGGAWHEAVVWADFELSWDNEMDAMLKDRASGSLICSFADTCHSGGLPRGIIEREVASGQRKQAASRIKSIPLSRCNAHKRAPTPPQRALKDVIYFSGCQADEYSYDAEFDGRPNGAMTFYLLKSLKELPEGATFNALYKQLRKYLPNADYNQTPERSGSAANLKRIVKPKG